MTVRPCPGFIYLHSPEDMSYPKSCSCTAEGSTDIDFWNLVFDIDFAINKFCLSHRIDIAESDFSNSVYQIIVIEIK